MYNLGDYGFYCTARWLAYTVLVLVATILLSASVQASPLQPNSPVRIIVSHPAGGTADTLARILASALSQSTNRVVVVDNRNGAGGAVGLSLAARANADGNTLVLATASHAIITAANAMPTANLARDFRSVSKVGSSAYVLMSSTRLPRDIKSVLAAPAGTVRTLGFSGAATHLWSALLQSDHRPGLTLINFSSPALAGASVVQGEIDLAVMSVLSGLSWIKQGRVLPLMTTGQQRSSRLPDVAIARELGFPELESASWSGIVVPLAASDIVVNYWNQEIRRVLATESVLEKYRNLEVHVNSSTPENFSKFMNHEIKRWQHIMVRSGIKMVF